MQFRIESCSMRKSFFSLPTHPKNLNMSALEEKKVLENLNRRLLLAMKWIFWLAALISLLGVAIGDNLLDISERAALYVPAINKLLSSDYRVNVIGANILSLNAIALSVYLTLLFFGQDIVFRFKRGLRRNKGDPLKGVLFVYFLSLPTCLAILGILFYAPVSIPVEPRLWGQVMMHFWLSNSVAFSILTPVLVVSIALLLFVALTFLAVPVLVSLKKFN